MALIAHLFGSPPLLMPVGRGGKNRPADVRTVKALINPYLRAQGLSALSLTATDDYDVLAGHIEDFQKDKLKGRKSDGRIDPGGKTQTALILHLRSRYTVKPIIPPAVGRLTWGVEGGEGGDYHTRRLHVPNKASGLTLGRGYDLKERKLSAVKADLAQAGVTGNAVSTISAAAGRFGADASRFVIDNDLLDYEITPEAQLKLFEKVYREKLAEVKRISGLSTTVSKYGKVDWNKLDQRILDILVDLIYRGDYIELTRNFLQKHVVDNDFDKFKAQIIKRSNWLTVPKERFEARKAYLEKGLPKP